MQTQKGSSYAAGAVLLFLLAVFVVVQSVLPLGKAVKIGADEDSELSRALLVSEGYTLYADVWNDQPPFYTFVLSQVHRNVSPSILASRLVTSGFAVLLLSSFFVICHRLGGLLAAGVAVALLMASPGFLELASSCMVEVPSLAPVMAALCLLLVGPRTRWRGTELAAGALFGLALQIKYIGIVYLPLAALILFLRQREAGGWTAGVADGATKKPGQGGGFGYGFENLRKDLGKMIVPGLVLGASLLIGFVAINLATGQPLMLQMKLGWAAHFAPVQSFEYGSPEDHRFAWVVLARNWDTTLLALIGLVFLWRRASREAWAVLPLGWLGLMLAVFATHTPWWSYYYVHTAVPLCLCAGMGIEEICRRIQWRRMPARAVVLALFAAGAAAWSGARVYLQVESIRGLPRLHSELVLAEIERYQPFAEFLFTDEEVYTFHAGIPMPPGLAATSLKRMWSGEMSNARLAAELREIQPGLLLVANDSRELPYQDLIREEYRLVYYDSRHRLYAHRTIAGRVEW